MNYTDNNVGSQMHVIAMKMAKADVLEWTNARIIEGITNADGGMVSFPVILSQNGEILPNHDHSKTLQNERRLFIDSGAEVGSHYVSDFTGTIPVSSKFTQKNRKYMRLFCPQITGPAN